MAQTKQAATTEVAKLKKFQEETVNKVLAQVNQFQEMGALDLPENYSPANALKAAWFTLIQTQTRDKKPVLDVCTNASVVNSLMEMVTQGLNPAKKQCAFIAYGNQLQMQREYFGSIALAKRYDPNVVDVSGEVIRKGDKFKYRIENGRKYLVEHDQPFENLDKEIIGAYATVILDKGESYIVPMTMKMIQAAWNQGAMNGNSPAHKNFEDQMAIKTAINRACKPYINASDDAEIVKNKLSSGDVVPKTANQKQLPDIEDGEAEEVKDEKPANSPEEKQEETSEELTVKNIEEAKEVLLEMGVHPAALEGTNIYEMAKDKGIVIQENQQSDRGF